MNSWYKKSIIFLPVINLRMKNYTFKIANGQEREETFVLRYKVFCEEIKFLQKKDYIDRLERDEYDDFSVIFVAKDKKGKIVGTIRLIPNHIHHMPTEKYYPQIRKYTKNTFKYAELSRFIIIREYRGKEVALGLIKTVILYAFKNNFSHYIITTSETQENIYRKFGFKTIGNPYKYRGVNDKNLSVTMISDIKEGKRIMPRINPFFNRFLYCHNKNILI